jgi:nucleoside-diphosphate-sugar epimerase
MSKTRSVLVTGANGFIGKHVVRALVEMGHEVTVLQRSNDAPRGLREILLVDQFTPDTVQSALAGRSFDWVLHLAAYGVDPKDREIEPMLRVNVDVTRALIGVAGTWPATAVFVAGSGAEYALQGVDRPVSEDHPLERSKAYGASKAAGTLCALALAGAAQLPLAVGRLFGVYGPGEAPHRLLPALINRLEKGQRAPLTPGSQRRDFLYVTDVVEGIIATLMALEKSPRQAVLNITTGEPKSVRAFAEAVAQELGAPYDLLGFGDLPMREGEVACFSGEPARMLAFTGWRPRHDLTTGIARAIGLLREEAKA